MKYILKILGYTQNTETMHLFDTFERDGCAFWRDSCEIWFSSSNFVVNVEEGDIIIQYMPLTLPEGQKDFRGLIVGCYKAKTGFNYDKLHLHNHWTRYVNAENITPNFSTKFKDNLIDGLNIKDILTVMPNMQCGSRTITQDQAQVIFNKIKEAEEKYHCGQVL